MFGERCEICGHRTLYVDDMTIIINTTGNIIVRMAMKIDFLIGELGEVLQFNGLMLNTYKTEILKTTTRLQLAANGEDGFILQTKNKKGEKINLKAVSKY